MSRPRGERPQKLRLFYALWPGEALRARLAIAATCLAADIDGARVSPANLHVTLVFLGMVPGVQLAKLIEVGGAQGWPEVPIQFDLVEYWSKPRVLVVLPSNSPDAGRAIVDGLWSALEPLGFDREMRPWRPHLTLVRRIRRPPMRDLGQMAVVQSSGGDWRLALVESVSHPEGARYKPLADWPLIGDL